MRWLKQHWRGICRVVSLLFLCTGACFGYWWLYKFAPSSRTLHPGWRASHSQQEYWREVQKGIHRGMWFHDDGYAVGLYGDKSWAEWIMVHVEPGTDMSCMGSLSHSATAMRYITNQNVGNDADAWLEWWEDNRLDSQLDWIEKGFCQHGYDIDVPPSAEQIATLLALLGNSESEEPSPVSNEMQYNAFRCLRDSGFESVAFAISNRELSMEAERGLLVYANMEQHWPPRNRLGILPFEEGDAVVASYCLPVFLRPGFQIMANALVFGPLLLGVILLIHSCVKRRSS